MPTLAHIYIRTPQGRFTAFNPSAVMLQPLKALLKAVDGKLTTSELELTLSHLGNVEALLEDLESAGLIADKSIAFSQVGTTISQDSAFVDGDNPLMQTNFGGLGGDGVNPWQNTAAGALDALTPAPMPVSAPAKPDTVLDRMAQQLADTMATFVLTHMPEKAFKELIAIENIHTPQQLEAALPQYEILVQPLGEVGIKHIAQLRQLMHKIFAQ
jgi:hypothetical protein